jgi:hypothetical protein
LKLSNLFTVAFSVNLLLFLLAVYFIYSISGSFSELESVAVYDPFSVGAPVPTVLDVALHVHVVCCLFSPNITHHQMPLVLTPAPTFLHMHTLHVTLCGLFPLSTMQGVSIVYTWASLSAFLVISYMSTIPRVHMTCLCLQTHICVCDCVCGLRL